MNVQRMVDAALLRHNSDVRLTTRLSEVSVKNNFPQALLVVDLDYADKWDPYSIDSYEDTQRFAELFKGFIARIRMSRHMPIIFVMFDPDPSKNAPSTQLRVSRKNRCLGCSHKENRLAEFLDHSHRDPVEPIFGKYDYDAFSNPKLAPYLRSRKVKEILLAGAATSVCVKATARGAVHEGFNVTLIEDATSPPFYEKKERDWWIREVRAAARLTPPPAVAINPVNRVLSRTRF